MPDKHFETEPDAKSLATEGRDAGGEGTPSARKDLGSFHYSGHRILSRDPLEALVKMGENVRSLRQIERGFRLDLRPPGPVGEMLFDSMFSSHLRSMIAGKLEARVLLSLDHPGPQRIMAAHIAAEDQPTMVFGNVISQGLQTAPGELYSQLALIQRYDGHCSREKLRYLGLILALKNAGELGLAKCICKSSGANKTFSEG